MKKTLSLLLASFLYITASAQKNTDTIASSKHKIVAFRVQYDDVFTTNANGSITPKFKTIIGGKTLERGVPFSKGVFIRGIDVSDYRGHDLLIDTLKGVLVVLNIFK